MSKRKVTKIPTTQIVKEYVEMALCPIWDNQLECHRKKCLLNCDLREPDFKKRKIQTITVSTKTKGKKYFHVIWNLSTLIYVLF